MQLTSSAFDDGGQIPAKYTCDGDNISPPLQILGVPESAQSLALIVDDPDATTGTADPGWVHWVLFNLPPNTQISEGKIPTGAVLGQTDFRESKYGGPCPPSGTHHYVFRLYALDSMLSLPPGATKAEVLQATSGRVLDEANLTGLYSKH